MLQERYPYFLANTPVSPNQDLVVYDKYSGEVATRVALADAEAILMKFYPLCFLMILLSLSIHAPER